MKSPQTKDSTKLFFALIMWIVGGLLIWQVGGWKLLIGISIYIGSYLSVTK